MLQVLKDLDVALFLMLNQLHHPVLDFLFYWISNKFLWIPLYAYLLWYLYNKEKRNFPALIIAIIIAITLSDQIASTVLKHLVMRLRPCHDPSIAAQVHTVYGYCGGLYGFVSSHASNSFALLAFILTLLRGQVWTFRYYLVFWACLHSYSRIYLGAHYPGDIVGGALLGGIIGYSMARFFLYYKKIRYPFNNDSKSVNEQ